MKRPLLVIGCSYLIAAAVCICGDLWLCLAVGAAGLLSFVGMKARGRWPAARLSALSAGCSALACAAALLLFLSPAKELAGQKAMICGRVEELLSGRSAVILTDTVNGEPLQVRFRASFYSEEGLSLFDRVEGSFTLRDASSEGGYANRAYARSRRLFLAGSPARDVRVSAPQSFTILQRLQLWREGIAQRIQRFLPRYQGGMTAAMALGRQDLLEEGLVADFRTAGLSHLLVVSGMHLSCVAGAVCALLRRWLSRRASAAVSMVLVLAAMLFMGSGVSVLRAGWMILLCLCGEMLGQEADPLNSLGFAVLMVCVWNPFAAAGVGLWLSAAAVLGLLTAAPLLQKALAGALAALPFQKAVRFAAGALSASLCAYLFTFPISALAFGEVSLAAPAANLLAAPLAPLAVGGSLLTVLTAAFPALEPFCRGLAFFTGIFQSALAGIARAAASLPGASLPVSSGYLALWAAGLVPLGLPVLLRPGRRMAAAFVSLSLISLSLGYFSWLWITRDVVFLDFLGSGNEITVTAVCRGHAVVAGELADPEIVADTLRRRGVQKLDLLIRLPSSARDGPALNRLLTQYPPDILLKAQGENSADAPPPDPCQIILYDGSRVRVMEGGAVLLDLGGTKTLILPDNCVILEDTVFPVDLLVVKKRPQGDLSARYVLSPGVLYGDGAPVGSAASLVVESWEPAAFRGRDGRLAPG
ncbi:MAG: ComEC/Rec2 family competence protein [Oscillospiraceae bacterium]|nr:ComEC/Rec2 family competence protein [Oscillospiraceae bacterium]